MEFFLIGYKAHSGFAAYFFPLGICKVLPIDLLRFDTTRIKVTGERGPASNFSVRIPNGQVLAFFAVISGRGEIAKGCIAGGP
jgi:hypothetical protein